MSVVIERLVPANPVLHTAWGATTQVVVRRTPTSGPFDPANQALSVSGGWWYWYYWDGTIDRIQSDIYQANVTLTAGWGSTWRVRSWRKLKRRLFWWKSRMLSDPGTVQIVVVNTGSGPTTNPYSESLAVLFEY